MKSKKMIAIFVFCLLILTSVVSLSTTGLKIEATNDSWVKITKPIDGRKIILPLTLKAEASPDIDYVVYSFYYDYQWHESESWRADEPPFTYKWNEKSLEMGDSLKIKATAYKNLDNNSDFSQIAAVSEIIEVTILKGFSATMQIKVHKAYTGGRKGVEGVKVTCRGINLFNDYENVQITDENGNCEFGGGGDDYMPYPGKYKFIAEKEGYKTVKGECDFKLGDSSYKVINVKMFKKPKSTPFPDVFSNFPLLEKIFSQSFISRLLKI